MIGKLSGILDWMGADQVLIDVHGVGYEVTVPLSVVARLPQQGAPITLYIHSHVREEAFDLYGFSSMDERVLFKVLLSASGVGPKMALAMLSRFSPMDLVTALITEDNAALVSIPGVGKKMAEKLTVELRDKMKKIFPDTGSLAGGGPAGSGGNSGFAAEEDLRMALISLGYKRPTADKVIAELAKTMAPDAPVEELVRGALAQIRRG